MKKTQGNAKYDVIKCWCGANEYIDFMMFDDEPDTLYISMVTPYQNGWWDRIKELFKPRHSWEVIVDKNELLKTINNIKWPKENK